MASIKAIFKNEYSESRRWVILDIGRDPNSPPVIFDGYLDSGSETGPLEIYSSDSIYGKTQYQRSDGAPTIEDSITEGSVVRME